MDALRMASLLCSRLCHDLVGPASAVVNGLELMETGDGAADKEAMDLVAMSAAQVTSRLQIFRGAFGAAAGLTFSDARMAAVAYFGHGKIALDWPDGLLSESTPGAPKIMLNLLLLGAELLGRGGRLVVGAQKAGLAVRVVGPTMRTDELALLDAGPAAEEHITARNVQPYFLGRLAAAAGRRVRVEAASDELRLTLIDAS